MDCRNKNTGDAGLTEHLGQVAIGLVMPVLVALLVLAGTGLCMFFNFFSVLSAVKL